MSRPNFVSEEWIFNLIRFFENIPVEIENKAPFKVLDYLSFDIALFINSHFFFITSLPV